MLIIYIFQCTVNTLCHSFNGAFYDLNRINMLIIDLFSNMRQNEYILAVIHSAGIRVPFYWVDPKVHSGFSITSNGKT